MIKAKIIVQVEDGNNVYNVGDKVRVLMKPMTKYKSGSEYIGKIVDIQPSFLVVDTCRTGCKVDVDLDYVVLHYQSIDRMRFAKENEDFMNTWNFDD